MVSRSSIASAAFLKQVGEGLVDHRPVEVGEDRGLGQVDPVAHVRVAGLLEDDGLADQLAEVEGPALGRGHPRELRELVDDAAEVVGLAHDHVGVLLERGTLRADHRAELAAQALGRELDRGERVLDLVGDAPGDVAPRRHALRHDEVGHVVEGDDVALEVAVVGLAAGDADEEVALAGAAAELDLGLGDAALALVEAVEEVGELRHRLADGAAGRGLEVEVDEGGGGGVHHLDAPGPVEADDPGGDPGEHRVEEPPPPLGLGVGGDELVALALHLAGHLVEGPSEQRDLVVAPLLAHAHVEVAVADALGRRGEPADGPRQALGEPQAGPHRPEDDDEGEADVDEGELEEQPPAVGLELLVEPHRRLGVVEEAQDLPVDVAADVEEMIGEGREPEQRPELVVLPVLDDDGLAVPGALDVAGGRGRVPEQVAALAAGPELAVAVDDVGLGQRPLHLELAPGQQVAELAADEERVALLLVVEEVAELAGVALEGAAVLVLVGLRRGERVRDDVADAVREPALEAEVQGDGREDRDEDRRDQRDQR